MIDIFKYIDKRNFENNSYELLESYLKSSYEISDTIVTYEVNLLCEENYYYNVIAEGSLKSIWDSIIKFINKIIDKIKEWWKKIKRWLKGDNGGEIKALKGALDDLPTNIEKPFKVPVDEDSVGLFTTNTTDEQVSKLLDMGIKKISEVVNVNKDAMNKLIVKVDKDTLTDEEYNEYVTKLENEKQELSETLKEFKDDSELSGREIAVEINNESIKNFKRNASVLIELSGVLETNDKIMVKQYEDCKKEVIKWRNELDTPSKKAGLYKKYIEFLNFAVKVVNDTTTSFAKEVTYFKSLAKKIVKAYNSPQNKEEKS